MTYKEDRQASLKDLDDAKSQSDLEAVAEPLESYYNELDYRPSAVDISSTELVSKNLEQDFSKQTMPLSSTQLNDPMANQSKHAQLDMSAFSQNSGKSGDFFVDNFLKVLGGFVLSFIFIVTLTPNNKYIGLPLIVVWSVSLQLFFRHTGKIGKAKQHEVLQQFANNNGFVLRADDKYSSSGVVFQAGNNDHRTGEILAGSLYGHSINMYIHEFSTSSGKSRMTHYYGVIEIELPKVVPHVFIDSKKNNWLFGETLDVFKAQRMVELEGDFNEYFRIFAAKDYDIEVLTLLNPAFMQQLIQHATEFELELIDNKAFVYVNNVIFLTKDSVIKMFEAAEFLTINLDKQLDTFKFKPLEERPNHIQNSLYKKIVSKI